jgi:hypothetical protein
VPDEVSSIGVLSAAAAGRLRPVRNTADARILKLIIFTSTIAA